ncbi:MAG: hypothetical protein AAFR47_17535 [Pseudomonadota bacterium]
MRCLALAVALLIAACTTSGDGTDQLRAQVGRDLRSAGVSQDCIDRLELPILAQAKGIANDPTRSSLDAIRKRQRLRYAVSGTCPEYG